MFPDLSSAGSITSITLGSPEADRRGSWKACGTRFVCPSLLSRVRAQDPGAPWPHGGAAQPSLRPILGNHPVNPDESWRRFDLVPSFCGGQNFPPILPPVPSPSPPYQEDLK
jgi:hypothetical protein